MYKLNKYKLSDDGTYWIGTTNKNDEFWFDGEEDTVFYIKSCNWRKRTDGYFQNYEGKRLHRVVMKENNSNIMIDHITNNKFDNRVCSLRRVSWKENNKNKKSIGKTGITGLCERNDRYFGCITIDGIPYRTKTKEKKEAYIDLLIVQREYGYLHNEKDFFMLDSISQNRIDEIINLINKKIQTYVKKFIESKNKNRYELSEDKMYYICFTNNVDDKNSFKISLESKCKIEMWNWNIYKSSKGNKYYIHGRVGNKTYLLHRYLLDLEAQEYSAYFIDHINGDGLDNKLDNLIITDIKGNNSNIKGKGFHMTKYNKYRVLISCGEYNKRLSKTFDNEIDAVNWYAEQKKIQLSLRKTWKNKECLITYLNSNIGA